MSEQQMVYAVSEHDFPARIAWHHAARDLERMVMVEAEKPEAAAELQRAADLLTLADFDEGIVQIWKAPNLDQCVSINPLLGPVWYFVGPTAIAEAAAFVRGQR